MGGDAAAKEFTKEERALLKFQKKQQHGQVCLLVLVVVVASCIFFFSRVCFQFWRRIGGNSCARVLSD